MYTFDSRVRYSETDSGGKLTMASLINYFQDCSTFQAEELGVGVEYLRALNALQSGIEPDCGREISVSVRKGYRMYASL